MFKGIATILLLVVSNAFMTLAWYGHIAFKSRLERFGLTAIVLLSWGIAVRILFPGPGQPHRKRRIRGPVLDLGAESHSGGRVALGVHRLRAGLHEIRHSALEPPRRFPLPDTGGLLHLPEIAAPAAGRAAKPDRRYLPTKSIRILPGPSFPVTPALPAGHGGKSDRSSQSSATRYMPSGRSRRSAPCFSARATARPPERRRNGGRASGRP